MYITDQKGLMTELECQHYLIKLGYRISIPIGDHCRYDMIADINGKLIKIQIKTCRETPTGIQINTSCVHLCSKSNKYKINSYTDKDIDYFATYYKDKMYLFPVNLCNNGSKVKNFAINQSKYVGNILLKLDDFLAEIQINNIINGITPIYSKKKYVLQYDKNMNFLKKYNSTREALKAIGRDYSHNNKISYVCNLKAKSAYGYIWRWEIG